MADIITAEEAKEIASAVNPSDKLQTEIDAEIRKAAAAGDMGIFVRNLDKPTRKALRQAGYTMQAVSGPQGEHWSVTW